MDVLFGGSAPIGAPVLVCGVDVDEDDGCAGTVVGIDKGDGHVGLDPDQRVEGDGDEDVGRRSDQRRDQVGRRAGAVHRAQRKALGEPDVVVRVPVRQNVVGVLFPLVLEPVHQNRRVGDDLELGDLHRSILAHPLLLCLLL